MDIVKAAKRDSRPQAGFSGTNLKIAFRSHNRDAALALLCQRQNTIIRIRDFNWVSRIRWQAYLLSIPTLLCPAWQNERVETIILNHFALFQPNPLHQLALKYCFRLELTCQYVGLQSGKEARSYHTLSGCTHLEVTRHLKLTQLKEHLSSKCQRSLIHVITSVLLSCRWHQSVNVPKISRTFPDRTGKSILLMTFGGHPRLNGFQTPWI